MTRQGTPKANVTLTGISASQMALILHRANSAYSETEIGQALYNTYPLLTASNMINALTETGMYPSLDRAELINALSTIGYTQAETLNAVTAQFPFINTGIDTLTGTLGSTSSDILLNYGRANMTYVNAAYWYDQSAGPEVSVQSGIFFIGNPSDSSHSIITGQYKTELFPDTDRLKQQIICLMAYVLQYPYPPIVSTTH